MVEVELTEVHVEGVIVREKDGERELLLLAPEKWSETIAHIVQKVNATLPEPAPMAPDTPVRQVVIHRYNGDGTFSARIEFADGDVEWDAARAVAVALQRGVPIFAAPEVIGGGDYADVDEQRDGMYPNAVNLDLRDGARGWSLVPGGEVEDAPHGRCFVLKPSDTGLVTQAIVEQAVRSEPLVARRMRFGGMVRTTNVTGEADVYVRVHAPGDRIIVFAPREAMHGDSAWSRFEIAFEVPAHSNRVVYGARIVGEGELRVGPFDLETLGRAGDGPTDRVFDSLQGQILNRPKINPGL